MTPAAGVEFNFDDLLFNAIVEEQRSDDCAEGHDVDCVVDGLLPIAQTHDSPLAMPQPAEHAPGTANPLPFSLSSPPSTPSGSCPPNGPTTSGSGTARNRRRARQREQARRIAPYGAYEVRATTVNKYVRPAIAVETDLDTPRLPHTINAYTGGRDTGRPRRVYELDELVGENSKLGFKLVEWCEK